MTRTKHFAKELATAVMLTCAAVIGAVFLFSVIAAIINAGATTPQGAPATGTHLVACNLYLSHQAMVLNQVDHVGPLPTPAFCTVAN